MIDKILDLKYFEKIFGSTELLYKGGLGLVKNMEGYLGRELSDEEIYKLEKKSNDYRDFINIYFKDIIRDINKNEIYDDEDKELIVLLLEEYLDRKPTKLEIQIFCHKK